MNPNEVIGPTKELQDRMEALRRTPPPTSEKMETQLRAVEAIRWNYDEYPPDLKSARERAAKCHDTAASDPDIELLVGPVIVPPDLPARMVRFPDGSSRIETWYRSVWIPGGTSAVAMLGLPNASADELHALGVR